MLNIIVIRFLGYFADQTDNALNLDGDLGICGRLLWVLSGVILVLFFPFSLCYAIRVSVKNQNMTIAFECTYIYLHVTQIYASILEKKWRSNTDQEKEKKETHDSFIIYHNHIVPFSVYFFKLIFQVVQEYERAILFRLGRVVPGGPKGPGHYSFVVLLFYTHSRIFCSYRDFIK